MQDNKENFIDNKRIAKNTLMLYMRMMVLMFIGLFTSRVILDALGVEDYGISNVVAGFIALFATVTQSMSSTISRYITYHLGKGSNDDLRNVFQTSVNVQILYSLVVLILAETIGLWFLNTQLVIPEGRMIAANWLYQFSVVSMIITLISVPYDASIISHERMSVFAYISIFEAVAQLLVAYSLYLSLIDNLILFGILTAVVQWTKRMIMMRYCSRHFNECHYKPSLDKKLFKEMFVFAGWNFIGSSASVLRDHGGNILINLFFGPAINAANGIAMTINSKVMLFANNFQVALNPQITKSYASGNLSGVHGLISRGARFSFYLMLIIVLPLMLNMENILHLWLKNVPEHTVWLSRLALLFVMTETLSGPILTAVKANGNIRNYHIIVGGILLLNVPTAYCFFKMGGEPEMLFVAAIIIGHLALLARLIISKKLIGISPLHFIINVYCKVWLVAIVASAIPVAINMNMEQGTMRTVLVTIVSVVTTCISIYYVGCSKQEKNTILSKLTRFRSNNKAVI